MSEEAIDIPEPQELATDLDEDEEEQEETEVPEPQTLTRKVKKSVEWEEKELPEPEMPMLTMRIIVITMLTSVGSLQHGYYLWVVKHPAVSLEEDPNNSTYHQKKKSHATESTASLVNTLNGIIFSLGGIIGCLLVIPLVNKCGRKGALLLNNYLSIIVSVLMGYSVKVNEFEFTFFAHLLMGMCTGIFSCIVHLYLGEIAPQKWRGSLLSVSTLAVIFGLVLSDVLVHSRVLGSEKAWPYLLSFNGFLALSQIIILPAFPESPRYLLIQRKNEQKAKQVLQCLRGHNNVAKEIQQLHQEDISDRVERNMSQCELLTHRSMRWQILSVFVLVCGQNLTGLIAIFYYAEKLVREQWLNDLETDIFTVLIYVCVIVSLLVAIFTVDRVGRKILLFIGYGVSTLFCILLVMTLGLQDNISKMAYVTSSLLLLFMVGHMLGPGPVTNVLLIELFLQSSRPTGVAIGGALHWLLNILAGVVFVTMEESMGSLAFFLFLPMCFVAFFYTAKIIPETTNKSFQQIKKIMKTSVTTRNGAHPLRQHPSNVRRRSTQQSIKRKRRRSSTRSTRSIQHT